LVAHVVIFGASAQRQKPIQDNQLRMSPFFKVDADCARLERLEGGPAETRAPKLSIGRLQPDEGQPRKKARNIRKEVGTLTDEEVLRHCHGLEG
jgi:hypothetical protein